MAVRFDAAADRLLRTTDLLDYNAAYTRIAWVYVVTDLAAISTFWSANDNSVSNFDNVRISAARVLESRVVVGGSATSAAGSTLATGTWYHIASVRESVAILKIYLDGALDSTNTRDITGRTAATRLECGAYTGANTNRPDARIDRIKVWTAALTIDEIQAEMHSIRPQRTADLYGFWPTFTGATERARDYSGSGRNWTESGTLTDEDPAPASWGAQGTRLIVPEAVAAVGQPMALRHTLDRTGARQIGRGIGQ